MYDINNDDCFVVVVVVVVVVGVFFVCFVFYVFVKKNIALKLGDIMRCSKE